MILFYSSLFAIFAFTILPTWGYLDPKGTVYRYQNSFRPPFGGTYVPFWETGGSTVITESGVRLTDGRPNEIGWVRGLRSLRANHWEMRMTFVMGSSSAIGTDGLALWITPNKKLKPGNVYGMSDIWEGLLIIFDTMFHDNRRQRQEPRIYAIYNDGTMHYDGNYEPYALGSCAANFRQMGAAIESVTVLIIYKDGILRIEYDPPQDEETAGVPCFSRDVNFAADEGYYYITISATTGKLFPDMQEVQWFETWAESNEPAGRPVSYRESSIPDDPPPSYNEVVENNPPPVDNYYPPPEDNLNQPPQDIYYPPPEDNLNQPPQDIYYPPPDDNLNQPPQDIYYPPPEDNLNQPPQDYYPPPEDNQNQPPQDYYLPPEDNLNQPPQDYYPPPEDNLNQPPQDYYPPPEDNLNQPPQDYYPPPEDTTVPLEVPQPPDIEQSPPDLNAIPPEDLPPPEVTNEPPPTDQKKPNVVVKNIRAGSKPTEQKKGPPPPTEQQPPPTQQPPQNEIPPPPTQQQQRQLPTQQQKPPQQPSPPPQPPLEEPKRRALSVVEADEIYERISLLQKKRISSVNSANKKISVLQDKLEQLDHNWKVSSSSIESGFSSFRGSEGVGSDTVSSMRTTLTSITAISRLMEGLEQKMRWADDNTERLNSEHTRKMEELAILLEGGGGGWGYWLYLLVVQIFLGVVFVWCYKRKEGDVSLGI